MSISIFEIVVVFVVALILFGPEQLPVMARQFGKLAGEFRKTSNALRREWYNAVYPPAQELRREFNTQAVQLRALKSDIVAPLPPTSSSVKSAEKSTGTAARQPETKAVQDS